jgi:hypothetical protein
MVILKLRDMDTIEKMKMEDGHEIQTNLQNLLSNKKMTIEKKKILNYVKNKKV